MNSPCGTCGHWKIILVRTVADGGESYYVCGDPWQTVQHLRRAALRKRNTEN
ncbi:MAG: hypothetical protein K8R36_09415 [Planctomycetales bacterium]|nr:hypothetical protein [Planctomycetales bacterium]